MEARPTLVFVTVSTASGVSWLANDKVHSVLRDIWFEADRWETGVYVLMPDHIHLFAWPGRIEHNLDAWICYWKSLATERLANSLRRWQNCSFHHTIRSFESAEAKRNYILQNPVRRGLVQKPEDWPYQGEIFRYDEWWQSGVRQTRTSRISSLPNPHSDTIAPEPSHGPIAEPL